MHRRALKEEQDWRSSGLRFQREHHARSGLWKGVGGRILLYVAIVTGVSVVFVVINHAALWLVPAALPSALILGVFLHFVLGSGERIWDWSVARSGRVHAIFLLFFLYLPVFVALYYVILAYPLGLALSRYASPVLADDYRRWILDIAAVVSMGSWGRLVYCKFRCFE